MANLLLGYTLVWNIKLEATATYFMLESLPYPPSCEPVIFDGEFITLSARPQLLPLNVVLAP